MHSLHLDGAKKEGKRRWGKIVSLKFFRGGKGGERGGRIINNSPIIFERKSYKEKRGRRNDARTFSCVNSV